MSAITTPEERQWRLTNLAQEWNIPTGPMDPPSLSRPISERLSASFPNVSPNDDYMADELLKRRRINVEQSQPAQGTLKRAFTSTKKKGSWEPKEIFDALDSHVANAGSAGVADALIKKLVTAGGTVNHPNPTNGRTGVAGKLLVRRKSLESQNFERSRLLQKAVENQQLDMVTVLVPHADPLALDGSLPIAMRSGNLEITQLLLVHGANASQTADGQDAFRQLCMAGGQANMVGLVLASDGRPSPEWISQAMVDAARKGCHETVLRISRSTADGSFDGGSALKAAVGQCRGDITLAILTGTKPPNVSCLNDAFKQLFSHATISPSEKLALAEMLLCAGAEGDAVSEALIQATVTEFYDMIDLLLSHGASIEYQEAKVIRTAISHGRASLVRLLLNEKTTLSATNASACVSCIPKRTSPEDRHSLLSLLLRKGAGGPPLSDALINAAEAGDNDCVKLLLSPHFPGGHLAESNDLKRGPRAMVYEKHEMGSVDHREGLALKIAAKTGNLTSVKIMLGAKPAPATLIGVFPALSGLPPVDRFEMIEAFLSTGTQGLPVSDALQHAVADKPPRRDERLITLLLKNNADVDFNGGAAVISSVANGDMALLETLLQKKPGPRTTMAAVSKAMLGSDLEARYKMIAMLVKSANGEFEGTGISEAMILVLQEPKVDLRLLEALVKEGLADVNFNQSAPIILAARHDDPAILDVLLRYGQPTPESLEKALQRLSEMPSTPEKGHKMEAVLSRSNNKRDSMSSLLVAEVQTVLNTPPENRALTVVKTLLSGGADINSQNGRGLCMAVKAGNVQLVDLLFTAKPNPASLAAAMPCALNNSDPMDRLTFTQKLLDAGAPAIEANRALVHAVQTYPNDLPLINVLAAKANSSDGDAITKAVKIGRPDILELILAKTPRKCTPPVLNAVLIEAMSMQEQGPRSEACALLLKAGATGTAVSEALLQAAADADLTLVKILVDSGARIEYQDGQAVVEACRAGASEVLKMLFSGPSASNSFKKQTLLRGFQAATDVGDLQKRCAVFRLLLERGVAGDAVDAQLVSAARFGDEGLDLVRLLLQWGSNPDHNSGEAIWTSTRSAFLSSLRMMLGVENVGGQQKKPSHATMIRSLKASWRLSTEPRYEVIKMLFEAGLPVTEEVHVGLGKAVNDEDVDMRLIQLLLDNGASPLTNGCQALSDATQKLMLPVLQLFLKSEVPDSDVSWAFGQAFTEANTDSWLSDSGLEVAKMLLEKGAGGESVASALVGAIDHYGTEKDAIARQFTDVLMTSSANVGAGSGAALEKAAASADKELIQRLLASNPNSEAISTAFPKIFDQDLSEEEALELISLFVTTNAQGDGLDTMFVKPDEQPVIFKALSRHPRSTKILQALLDAGYYPDPMTTAKVREDIEEEQVSLFFWALLQPQKKISNPVLLMLLENGAKADFETAVSKVTPLMLAVQSTRLDVVRALIMANPDVADVADAMGNTALTMATEIGGDVGTAMMSAILAAEPSKDDGSLHNAARELNLRAMQVLVEFGHDVDFPSPLHGGRSALGEICLHTADMPLTAAREKAMERSMKFLMDHGTDLKLQSDEKSVLLLALESREPVPTARALLKVGMWKLINQPFNNYTDGTYTYSPTEYVSRVMTSHPEEVKEQLIKLLKANRATNVYYANDGPQPEGATGLPEELLRAERERRARAERIRLEQEDHKNALARTDEVAGIQNRIQAERAAIEEARKKRLLSDEMTAIRERAAVEEDVFAQQVRRQKAERQAALDHSRQLAEAELERTRLVAATEFEVEQTKQTRQIEWERKIGGERLDNANQLSALRVKEREDIERIDRESDMRVRSRLQEHRQLIDSQSALAGQLTASGVNVLPAAKADRVDSSQRNRNEYVKRSETTEAGLGPLLI
ncbi:hypothetical protein MCOR19_005122 [Pyricularia oryzae]|nr:hypothetical protein MCOR19_005122 [Pyricularia oryzae]